MNYCSKCKRDLPEGEKCPVCTPKKGVFIEMEMPKSCKMCRFAVPDEDGILFCHAEGLLVTFAEERYVFKNRPSWCPLQEVKE